MRNVRQNFATVEEKTARAERFFRKEHQEYAHFLRRMEVLRKRDANSAVPTAKIENQSHNSAVPTAELQI